MFVIGTAGHVDHGKSTLVEALTGIHPDRLAEERERGLTIELGFAWMTLPSGREVSVIDVPGHVRFVRHMLAGVGAIDLAMFVIAADEGVMPQTREHLEILDLLEVQHSVIVLSKCDLVDDAAWLDLVAEDIRKLLDGTSLADAPIVRISATTGAGLDTLRETLDRALDETPEPHDAGRPRFGIDRVFTMPGFGTVVTGTLLDGRVRVGDSLEAVPNGPTARIRGLQSHQREIEEASPGTRVAINLSGVSTGDLRRGQVLAPPGRMHPVTTIDARVRVLDHRALRHNLRVAVHVGAAETQGRVRVLGGAGGDGDAIPAGERGWCQIMLAEPVSTVPGDLFVLRVSDGTVAGGRVIDVNAPRHRRTDPETIARLETIASGTPESVLLAALDSLQPCSEATLLADGAEPERSREVLRGLVAAGEVVELAGPDGRESNDAVYLSAAGLRALESRALGALETYERDHPLRHAMPREELRARLGLGQREYTAILPAFAPAIRANARGVARADWTPQLSAVQRREAEAAIAELSSAGMAPPRLSLDAELIAYLEGEGRIVDCGDGTLFAKESFEAARGRITELIERSGPVTLASARDALGTNRRAAQAFLERLDRDRVTRRIGDARELASGR